MLRRMIIGTAIVLLAGSISAAQTPKPAAPAKPAAETPKPADERARVPEPAGQPVNIKLEVTITDQSGPGESSKKVVSMIVGDRKATSIRSSATVPVSTRSGAVESPVVSFNYREVRINVDVQPVLLKDNNKISLNFGLEYMPQVPMTSKSAQERPAEGTASLNERLGLILESGKPVVVSQAADPTSDRRITVEVVATILR
jgi:predicted hotdog family 3-hydroxylacyl-ACP dehydratase